MSTTTQILFHSPALHSLKRDQLVKLCKIHGIKANGKNVELIERLKGYASQLPPEAADIEYAERNEEDGANLGNEHGMTDSDGETNRRGGMPRPSEQWEVIMEDIEEVDETAVGTISSMGTLRSNRTAGEFGSKSSKHTMTSSIKALANSLGIKRSQSSKSLLSQKTDSSPPDGLDQHAIPYSSLPAAESLPSTDHFKLSTPDVTMGDPDDSLIEPIPGSPSRPGAPAPSNARLSTGEGLTTTIRLITSPSDPSTMLSPPKLKPMQPSSDLIMSPGPDAPQVNVWPASPSNERRLYPAIPVEDLPSLNAIVASAANSPSKIMPKDDTHDIFSPQKPSDASSARKGQGGRLSVAQDQPFLFGSPLRQPRLSNKDFGSAAASVLEEMNKRLEQAGVQKVNVDILNKDATGDVFGSTVIPNQKGVATDRFAKAHDDAFNKMDSIVNHYAARRGLAGGQPATKKRKSDALGHGPAPGARKKSTVAGHTGQRVISNGVRKNMTLPGGFGDENDDFDDREESEEAEADEAGDRRASKRVRTTGTGDVTEGKRVSLAPSQPDQTAEERAKKERERDIMKKRLDASKARRRSSRGRPSVGARAAPKPSRFGFLSSAKNLVRNVWNMGAGGSRPAPSAPVSKVPVARPTIPKPTQAQLSGLAAKPQANAIGLGRPSTKPNAQGQVPRMRSTSGASNTSSQLTAKTAALGSARTRSPIPSFHLQAKTAGASSSTGTGGIGRSNTAARTTSATASSTQHVRNSSDGSSRIRPSSTLMAPTASSLAKTRTAIKETSISPRTLKSIVNTPPRSPPTKIFSKPLGDFGSPTTVPTPVHTTSLTAAAATIMAGSSKPAVPPKPSSLATRRPRISRSRVMAKVGAQRAVSTSSSKAEAGARTRSSLGAARRSFGAVKNSGAVSGDVAMSAKKARMSEYARRRSHIKAARLSSGRPSLAKTGTPVKAAFASEHPASTDAMELDDD